MEEVGFKCGKAGFFWREERFFWGVERGKYRKRIFEVGSKVFKWLRKGKAFRWMIEKIGDFFSGFFWGFFVGEFSLWMGNEFEWWILKTRSFLRTFRKMRGKSFFWDIRFLVRFSLQMEKFLEKEIKEGFFGEGVSDYIWLGEIKVQGRPFFSFLEELDLGIFFWGFFWGVFGKEKFKGFLEVLEVGMEKVFFDVEGGFF
jgi:hypothetical protein